MPLFSIISIIKIHPSFKPVSLPDLSVPINMVVFIESTMHVLLVSLHCRSARRVAERARAVGKMISMSEYMAIVYE